MVFLKRLMFLEEIASSKENKIIDFIKLSTELNESNKIIDRSIVKKIIPYDEPLEIASFLKDLIFKTSESRNCK